MNKLTMIVPVLILATILSGCATARLLDPNKLADKFYGKNNPTTYNVIEARGVKKIAFEFEGSNTLFAIAGEVNPKSIIPREPGVQEKLIDAVPRVAGIAAAAYIGHSAVKALGERPTVVTQPEPLVVRPEVIQVPAAGP